MSVTKNIFERIEKKYYLKEDQYNRLIKEIRNRLSPDEYGKSTINSLYFDTEDYRMIRQSIDAKVYKEKLRLRSYGVPDENSTVFLEIKKKQTHEAEAGHRLCRPAVQRQVVYPPAGGPPGFRRGHPEARHRHGEAEAL